MCVGTYGEVRFMSMEDLHAINAQAMLSNGYHLRNISPEIAQKGGLAAWSGWNGPDVYKRQLLNNTSEVKKTSPQRNV